jgi:hypothetical protein
MTIITASEEKKVGRGLDPRPWAFREAIRWKGRHQRLALEFQIDMFNIKYLIMAFEIKTARLMA